MSAKAAISSNRASISSVAKPKHRGIHIDVFAPGELGVEARAKFQQGGDAAIGLNAAAGRLSVPQIICSKGGFAAAIAADDADGFALFYFKGNILERPELAEVLSWRLSDGALQARHNELLEPVARLVVDLVALAEIFDLNGDIRGHRQSLSASSGTRQNRARRS